MKALALTGFDGCLPPTAVVDPPKVEMALTHVHGYSRGKVGFTAKGDVVFSAAGVGVVMQRQGGMKAAFTGHSDDVSCLAIDAKGEYAVTGEMGRKSAVCVWKADDATEVVRLTGVHKRGIAAVAFGAGDGSRIVTVGNDEDHYVCVWDWKGGAGKIAGEKGDKNIIIAAACNPYDGENDGMGTLVTVGVKHIKFWTLEGGLLKGRKGTLGLKTEAQPITCVAFVRSLTRDAEEWGHGYAVTGLHDGGVCIWKSAAAYKVMKAAHKGPVTAITVTYPHSDGGAGKGWVITGGRDGRVKTWDADALGGGDAPSREISVCEGLAGMQGGKTSVKSIGAWDGDHAGILVLAVGTASR